MKRLIQFELIKLLRKKSTLVVMAVSLIVTAFLFGLPILQYQTYSESGAIKGSAGIAYAKEQYTDLSVPLTDAYVAKTVLEVQTLFKNPQNVGTDGKEQFLVGDAYWQHIAPKESLLNLIASTYSEPGESAGYNKLANLADATGFQQAREKKIEKLLQAPARGMSDPQQTYWQNQNSKVKEPLQYGYSEGWAILLSSFELLMFALLAVCIVIAPVFAGEYQAGTDAVVLAAKYGKTKLVRAKTAASLLFGLLAFTLHIAVAFGLPLAAFGADGWNLPVQVLNTTIPYPFTCLQAAAVSLGVVYLILLAMIGLTLFLSANMKSPYLVLIVLVPILLIPLFLSPNGTTGAYNLILFLLPYRASVPELGKYISYQLGGLVLDAFSMRAVVYALLAAILLPLAGFGFKKHQVAA